MEEILIKNVCRQNQNRKNLNKDFRPYRSDGQGSISGNQSSKCNESFQSDILENHSQKPDTINDLIAKLKQIKRVGSNQSLKLSKTTDIKNIQINQNDTLKSNLDQFRKKYTFQLHKKQGSIQQSQNSKLVQKKPIVNEQNLIVNQRLLIEIRQKDDQIKTLKRQSQIYQQLIQEKDKLICQLQQTLSARNQNCQTLISELNQKLQLLESQNYELHCHLNQLSSELEDLKYIKESKTMQIQSVFIINLMPSGQRQTSEQNKMKEEIKRLKSDLVWKQNKARADIQMVRKKKEEELSSMRKMFSKNLFHYKQLIMKCTSKTQKQKHQIQENDLLDTTIVQLSSDGC